MWKLNKEGIFNEDGSKKGELSLDMEEPLELRNMSLMLKLDEETNIISVIVDSEYSESTDREKQETQITLPEDAFAGVRMLIETLRSLWQNTRILVMAVFPRLPKETMQKKIDRLNFLLAEYCSEISLKDPEIRFMDLSSQLKTKDGKFAPDLYVDGRTHPNNAGYAIWAEAIEPEIVAILRDR